ncbi:copper amine oxidase N-terminal domain-containing protein [Paenibacillus sp. N3/727]|uniref:copper amine oxidase N-terminal domain-containing protein n=1 Tax=Paenibacillus sp. N3/727 TaxID=2925845 RepID=UPI001F531D10|nr:copper amine oxidase N-terminal domain-containing protein [Paenibacillus sp. N3/727]UNK20168.1 copper amine oxidase N-terminal domain-containing protein [Paenibacillus sp. N3/727]
MKRIISFLVIIFTLCNFGAVHAQSNGDQEAIRKLIDSASIKTMDGFDDKTSGLMYDEGAIRITLKSQSDYDMFNGLSVDGKRKVMNTLAQSYWGDYLGVDVCYVLIVFNNKLYAIAETSYDAADSTITLQYFEQGSTDLTPWKNKSATPNKSTNNQESNSVKKSKTKVKSVTIKETGVIIKNNTMLPAAQVFNNLGGNVQLNSKANDIIMTYGSTTMKAKLNSRYVQINGTKISYSAPLQIINGKLMVPVQLIKNLFKADIKVEHDTYSFNSKYIKSITVVTDSKKVTVPINDLYESYQKYFGKTAWIIKPQVIITDLSSNFVSEKVKNLAQIKIINVKRDSTIGDWIDVYFIYKGKTYIANLKETSFQFGIYTVSPYKQYNFSQKYWNQIENMSISIGMTSDMVYLSWGLSDRHSKDTYSWGTTDIRVYERSYSGDKYLYFFNNILQSISTY